MRDFHGVILIDVWISTHQRVNQFYADLCDFLTHNVRFQHLILPNFGTPPMDSRFRQMGRVSTIDCWSDFKNLGYNQGDWLLGGQSWEMCTHQKPLGLMPALNYGIESQLFSHPMMVFPTLDDHKLINNQHFENDRYVKWIQQSDGFWKLQHLINDSSHKI